MQRIENQRFQPVHAGRVRLHHQHLAETVDHKPGEAVGLGMDQPVIGPVIKPLAQPQRPLQPAHEKPAADRPGGVAVEDARGEQRVRIEHRDPERVLIRAAQGHQRPRRQRLRRGVHRHLVGENPGMAGFGAAMAAGGEPHLRPAGRIVDFGRALGRRRRGGDLGGDDVGHEPLLRGCCRPIRARERGLSTG